MSDLPAFRYHPDPLSTGAIVQRRAMCPVCGLQRDFAYEGPFYSLEQPNEICPWCISNGAAAARYGGAFQDAETCEPVELPACLDELLHRTPGYSGWQQEAWLSHCGEPCAFLGFVGWQEVEHLRAELASDIEAIKNSMEMDEREFQSSLRNGGSHQGYLFRCVQCGHHRLTSDVD